MAVVFQPRILTLIAVGRPLGPRVAGSGVPAQLQAWGISTVHPPTSQHQKE